MEICVSTSQIRFFNVSWNHCSFLSWLTKTVLKATIIGDGVWKIRRREKSMAIEVFKVEEKGHGGILSDEFVEWRAKLDQQTGLNSHVENSTVQMNGLNVTGGDARQAALAEIALS